MTASGRLTTAPNGRFARRLPGLARGLWVVGVLLAGGEAWLMAANWGSPQMFFGGLPPVQLAGAVAIISIAAVVCSRVPGNPVGWLFFLVGFGNLTTNFASLYAIRGITIAPGSLPGAVPIAWFGTWSWIWQVIGLTLLVQLFPSGTPLSRRWAPFVYAAVVAGLVVMLTTAYSALPRPGWRLDTHGEIVLGQMPAIVNLGFVAMLITLVAGACEVAVRMTRARGLEREQLRWFAAAGTLLVAAAVVLIGMVVAGLPDSTLQAAAGVLAVCQSLLICAAGVAILRYRLYDIDIVIRRSVVYGGLALAITGVYLALIVGVGSIIGSRANVILAIVATAIVSLAFQPARLRLQRYANRLVYGKRATPYEVLSEFSERVAESIATEDLPARMAHVLGEATGAQRADVWLRLGDQLRPEASWPESAPALPALAVVGQLMPAIPGADRAVPVQHHGELLGALSLVQRAGDAVSPIEEKLLADLARQAGLVLRNVRLTAELIDRLEELRASRQRLVKAQDDERRRLERNIHDGAQQHLVALKMKLGLLDTLAERDAARTRALAVELKADADEALETLRDLARGIYPPLLADRGLKEALEGQARKATLPVEVDADGIGRYPQETEAAIYFCILEALQNVQKYAAASRATVRLAEQNGELHFDVIDDGHGFDVRTARRGAGLTNMTDRLDALGGRVEIASQPGHGTEVRASLPLSAGGAG